MSEEEVTRLSKEEIDAYEQDAIDRINKAPQWPDTILPELKENEIFHCCYCGNDEVKPVHYRMDYYKYTSKDGEVLPRRSIMDWKSDCCGYDFITWDTVKKQEMPWPSDKLHDELRDGLIVHTTQEPVALED